MGGLITLNKSPPCISNGDYDTSGKEATFEGYGYTSEGTPSEILKKESVSIIANDFCADMLRSNNSRHLINKRRIKTSLNRGLTDGIICTVGKYDESANLYTGPCRGDSGGPLYVDN